LNLIKTSISDISFSSFDHLTDVNDRWAAFCKTLIDIIDIAAPYKQLRARKRSLEWVDNDVRVLMHKRDKLFRLACSSGLPRSDPIWDGVRLLRNKCKSLIRAKMKSFFADKTTSFFKSSQKFWKFYRSSGTLHDKSNSATISSISQNNSLTTNSDAIANLFNQHFSNLKPSSFHIDSDCSDFVNNSFTDYKRHRNLKTSSFSFSLVSVNDVSQLIRNLNTSSSEGVSGIPVAVIKHCVDELAPFLTSFYNYCLQVSCIPNEWKQAIVLPLFKKGQLR
jgi:hypothetical protein